LKVRKFSFQREPEREAEVHQQINQYLKLKKNKEKKIRNTQYRKSEHRRHANKIFQQEGDQLIQNSEDLKVDDSHNGFKFKIDDDSDVEPESDNKVGVDQDAEVETSNFNEDSYQSIAQELKEDESINIRNVSDTKYKWMNSEEQKSKYQDSTEVKGETTFIPSTIVKPNKSVSKYKINEEKIILKSNASESASTRTDKNGKESFDSLSMKNSFHKIQLVGKKHPVKPPFVMNTNDNNYQSKLFLN